MFTTATFIGYVLAGFPGAALATLAIFLPGFALVAAIRPLVARVRRSGGAAAFLDGVNVAALALMAVVTVQLGRAALVDWPTGVRAALGAVLLVRFRVNSALLIAGGVFAMEAMSVILQVGYFKFTKPKGGMQGKRLFRCAPLHHHFELGGTPEIKVVRAFWAASFVLALAASLIK